jgi:hypothetical protein
MTCLLRAALAACVFAAFAGCSPRFDWREFRSPDGYAVLLPGRPQTVVRDIELDGIKAPMSMTSTGIGPTMFAVGVARLPAAAVADASARQKSMAYFRDALARNVSGQAIRQSAAPGLDSGGQPVLLAEAIEATGRLPDGRNSRLAARFFIVDDRLFQVVALGAEGEIPPEALDTFFTSFRLIR